jgi:hypothetical protein
MSDWMQYLYQQRPFPQTATGVQVHLTSYDPNGNFQDIGYTTSDSSGNFALAWTPPVPGTYYVRAEFEGSNAYSGSFDTTYFVVAEAAVAPAVTSTPPPAETVVPPTTAAPATPTPAVPTPTVAPPPAGAEPTMTYIAIGAVVVIVVAAAAALILRKRK